VARSARAGRLGLALAGLLTAVALAGCTSTQHEAQREQLDSARLRAALEPTRVTAPNQAVRPLAITEVSAGGSTALIVTVRNGERRAVSDLPISVGYMTAGGQTVYVNAGDDLNYFQSHLPAIRAGQSLVWVYTMRRAIPAGTKVFARVGAKPAVAARLTEMNVGIDLSYRRLASGSLAVTLDNLSSVPQYQLQVYAYATAGARYTGAGSRTVTELDPGARQTVRLGLVGTSAGRLRVEAVPTILQ
jgi:hypothetical protein